MYNNGKGIPVVLHAKEQVYVPELIFGHLLTSSNYDDGEKKVISNPRYFYIMQKHIYIYIVQENIHLPGSPITKVTGGRNGYGAKLCNIFSTEFIVETADKCVCVCGKREGVEWTV